MGLLALSPQSFDFILKRITTTHLIFLFRVGFLTFTFLEVGGGGLFSMWRSASSNLIPRNETAGCFGITELNHKNKSPASRNWQDDTRINLVIDYLLRLYFL